jgi:hypothetical protein
MEISDEHFPGLYQVADRASLKAQKSHFWGLFAYLGLLVAAAFFSFAFSRSIGGAIAAAFFFLVTLAILIALHVHKPIDIWYNGRAVAESVKTRAWRWMMRAAPYSDCETKDTVSKEFVNDLGEILAQNRSLAGALSHEAPSQDPISSRMEEVRALSVAERLEIYKRERIQDQATWYSRNSILNKKKSSRWFFVSVSLHALAVCMLLYRIYRPSGPLPVEVVATAAGAVLTWLQAKKYNELSSSYSLAAQEIFLIKGMAISISKEDELSDFVVNTEAAFSREHTQWAARKNT